jgi:long-chain acyl-CoA synthetase
VESNRPGFIQIRGGAGFRSYFQNPAATAAAFDADGWFRTGDFGYFAPSGDVYFLDRVSGLIRRSGENIAPREIEELLEERPGVAEAAVIGIPDDFQGEEIAAFVVPRDQALSEQDLELPHTPTVKVRLDALELSPAAVDRVTRRQDNHAPNPTKDGHR